jgi:hypothetical protein
MDIPWDVIQILLAGGALAALRLNVELLWIVIVGAAISVFLL